MKRRDVLLGGIAAAACGLMPGAEAGQTFYVDVSTYEVAESEQLEIPSDPFTINVRLLTRPALVYSGDDESVDFDWPYAFETVNYRGERTVHPVAVPDGFVLV